MTEVHLDVIIIHTNRWWFWVWMGIGVGVSWLAGALSMGRLRDPVFNAFLRPFLQLREVK